MLRTALLATALGFSIVAARATRPAELEVELAWTDAWRDDRNHDALWVTARSAGAPSAGLLRLAGIDAPSTLQVFVSDDRRGAFVSRAGEGRGDVSGRITLRFEEPVDPGDVRTAAIEMVFVPDGAFEAGDDHPDAVSAGAFFAPDEDEAPTGPVRIEDEGPLEVPEELAYDAGEVPQYRGDGRGPVPAAFPKGTRGFYVMKYELRQGQYARFLEELPEAWRAARRMSDREAPGADSYTIEAVGPDFRATAPERPCNFVSWDDTCAFLDWYGLRPMTELEFEKAARGPRRPLPLDYPWGTARRDDVERRVDPSRDLAAVELGEEGVHGAGERLRLGLSHYGVWDLSGSLWERVVSLGHPAGRAFRGTHGDGRLGADGRANQADWPAADESGRAADGIGYRGGAEYFAEPDVTNPFSPVAVRTYAAWNGAFRSPTYSARGVRTAPAP